MKKLTLFFYILLGLATQASSQSYLRYSVRFLDADLNTMPTTRLLSVGNSDSALGFGFSQNYPYGAYGYVQDSVFIDSSYHGNQATFIYYDCNGYQKFDTVFNTQFTLNVVIQTNCPSECDADFTYTAGANGDVTFFGDQLPNSYYEFWDFDNGQTATGNGSKQTHYSSAGTYLVTHIVINGSIGCSDTIRKPVTIYDSCYVDYTYTIDTGNTINFVSTIFPNDARRMWVFGDGNQDTSKNPTHTFPQAGNYEVILYVHGAGCFDSALKTIMVNTSHLCDAEFDAFDQSNFTKRFVPKDSSFGNPHWYINNVLKSQTQTYEYVASSAGNFNVRLDIKDANNAILCSTNKNFYFNSCGEPYLEKFVAGRIRFNGVDRYDYDSLKIYLITNDSALGLLTLVDSTILINSDSAIYTFPLCNPNYRYLVKAALLPNSSLYASYIPTYYDSSIYWSGATHFFGAQNLSNANINMVAGTNPGGPGFIGGYVTQGANKKDEPLENIQVLLLNDKGIPVSSLFTKNGGRFEFSNLALGKYYLTVEFPGKNSAVHFITLTEDKTTAENQNFEVNSTYILAINPGQTGIADVANALLSVYPNPVNDNVLYLHWNDVPEGQVQATFYSIDGKIQRTVQVEILENQPSTIDVYGLPNGFYILELKGNQSNSYVRIQKN